MATEQKRNLFEELKQGIEEINSYKEGKITLHTHSFTQNPRPKVNSQLVKETHENLDEIIS